MDLSARLSAGNLAALQRRLHTADDVDGLLARGAAEAVAFCDFDRAVILRIEEAVLKPSGAPAVDHAASDALRLRALARPLILTEQSDEVHIIREAEGRRHGRSGGSSVLAESLELEDHVAAALVPEARAVALLVVDRAGRAVDDEARLLVGVYAHLLGRSLERTVLRTRLHNVATEIRHLSVSATALTKEAMTSPVLAVPDRGWEAPFRGTAGEIVPGGGAEILTEREGEIAERLARGYSNRQIAAELHLSPDTVKTHVARVLRKLGVSNRTEAVAVYLARTGR